MKRKNWRDVESIKNAMQKIRCKSKSQCIKEGLYSEWMAVYRFKRKHSQQSIEIEKDLLPKAPPQLRLLQFPEVKEYFGRILLAAYGDACNDEDNDENDENDNSSILAITFNGKEVARMRLPKKWTLLSGQFQEGN
jgi:hypothetical protein